MGWSVYSLGGTFTLKVGINCSKGVTWDGFNVYLFYDSIPHHIRFYDSIPHHISLSINFMSQTHPKVTVNDDSPKIAFVVGTSESL